MRVLIGCTHWGLIGGSERYALDVSTALAERGHEITVLHATGDAAPPPGARLVRFEGLETGDAPRRDDLDRVLAELAPDVVLQLTPCPDWAVEAYLDAAPYVRFVQDHTLFCPGLDKMLAGGEPCTRPLGFACVKEALVGGGCSGLPRADGPRGLIRSFARLRAKRRELHLHARARLLITASESMRSELVAAGLPLERTEVLPYFTRAATGEIERADPPPATAEFLARSDAPIVLTPARLALPDKGIDYLLTALGLVEAPFLAVIAGEGPARPWLEQKSLEEGLANRVHFAGWLDAGALEGLYARASVVAFPSVWDEPFGLVGIEAMAHATPVVAFEAGAVPEWMSPGVGGLHVPRKDVAAMARAIDDVLGDPEHARGVGAAGSARVEREFRVERHVARLEESLERVARRVTAAGR